MTKIPKGQSLNVDDILERYANVLEVVEAQLHENNVQTTPQSPAMSDGLRGVIQFDSQSGAPIAPSDFTALDPLTLGQLHSYWTGWTNYYETLASAAKARVDIISERLDVVKAALECYYREEENLPVDLIPAKVKVDIRFVEWNLELSKARQFQRGADAQHAGFKRTINNISREQTRRSDETERTWHTTRRGSPDDLHRSPPGAWGTNRS